MNKPPDKIGSRIDEVHEPKRATDFSLAARISTWIVRWSPVIVFFYSIAYAWFLQSGYFIGTPKAQIDTLRAEIRTNRALTWQRIDSLIVRADSNDARGQKVVDILEVFSIDLCIRRKSDPYIYSRLRCDRFLKGADR